MAISRREILKRGVSYGTGVINFENDCIAYERELRKLANNTLLDTFLATLANVEQHILEQSDEAEELTPQPGSEALRNNAEASLENSLRNDVEKTLENNTDSPENPLTPALEAAYQFRDLCSTLALSDLYMKMNSIIATMQQSCLPAVEDLANIKADYAAIIAYLSHC